MRHFSVHVRQCTSIFTIHRLNLNPIPHSPFPIPIPYFPFSNILTAPKLTKHLCRVYMHFKNVSKKTSVFLYSQILFSPYVRESMKVLDSGSRPLDSGFQLSGFRNRYHSGFQIPNIVDSGFQSSGFRIPTAKICWIPDSGFSYMGRLFHEWSLAYFYCVPPLHSSRAFWCLLSWVDWLKVLPHFLHLNGFSPVWVRMWLFKVVTPENDLPQKPHLNGFSFMWITTCSLSSLASWKDSGQWPHW